MSEITQLREHFDKRCNVQDEKLDHLLLAIRGNGLDGPEAVEGLVARTNKNTHDIGGLKLVVPALGERVAKIEIETSELYPLKVAVPNLVDRVVKVEQDTKVCLEYVAERKDDRKWRNRLIIGAIVAVCGSTATSIALAVKANQAEKGQP